MGSYTPVSKPLFTEWLDNSIGEGDLWVRPCDFAKVFGNGVINPEPNKITRQYFFDESFADKARYSILVEDYKQTSAYDDHLPSPDGFWKSEAYACLSVHVAGSQSAIDASVCLWNFFYWVYSVINLEL